MSGLGYGKIDLIKKIVETNYGADPEKAKYQWNDVLFIIQEMLDDQGKKYLERDHKQAGKEKYKVFKEFVAQLVYRNMANYDTMLLLEGDKGTGKSSAAIMLARMWCKLLDIEFDPDRHIAYSNADVINKIDVLNKYEPLICLTGTTKIIVRNINSGKIKYTNINKLVGRTDFEVLSYDVENKKFEYIKPSRCVQTAKQAETFEVELENGYKVRATENHKFLTKRGYVALKDLSSNDEIVLYSKKCVQCDKEFHPKNNLTITCSKECSYNNYLIQNKTIKREKKIQYAKKYREDNKKILKIKRDAYLRKNKEIIKIRKKKYWLENKEALQNRNKKYWKNNKKKLKIKNKKYRENNKESINEHKKIKHKYYMETNPEYKIKRNLRRRLNLAIKNANGIKQKSMEEYLGCTIKEFKLHLKKQFVKGMSFDNYGEWHIDHIKPCATFNLKDIKEQKKCFHYSNLQPLWAKDNILKGAKYDYQ